MKADSLYGWANSVDSTAGPLTGFEAPQPVVQFDAELGQIFIQMRTLLGLSLWDMARAVGGEPPVVANLEAGAISALPPWPELSRLIDAYAGLTGIDPQPITARFVRAMGGVHPLATPPLQGRVQAPMPQHAPSMRAGYPMPGYRSQLAAAPSPRAGTFASTPSQPAAPHASVSQRRISQSPALAAPAEIIEPTTRTVSQGAQRAALSITRGIGRGVGRLLHQWSLVLIVLVVLPALLAITCRLAPGVAYATISPLPGTIYWPVRAGIDYVVALMAPVRDGLVWIDVGDQIGRAHV